MFAGRQDDKAPLNLPITAQWRYRTDALQRKGRQDELPRSGVRPSGNNTSGGRKNTNEKLDGILQLKRFALFAIRICAASFADSRNGVKRECSPACNYSCKQSDELDGRVAAGTNLLNS
jgi:hypothetical protein